MVPEGFFLKTRSNHVFFHDVISYLRMKSKPLIMTVTVTTHYQHDLALYCLFLITSSSCLFSFAQGRLGSLKFWWWSHIKTFVLGVPYTRMNSSTRFPPGSPHYFFQGSFHIFSYQKGSPFHLIVKYHKAPLLLSLSICLSLLHFFHWIYRHLYIDFKNYFILSLLTRKQK